MEKPIIIDQLKAFLREDLPFGDLTTDIVIDPEIKEAEVVCRSDGVIAGIEEARTMMKTCEIEVLEAAEDGSRVSEGDIALHIRGLNTSLLMVERTVLNLISRMSGIATTTATAVEAARKVDPGIRVAATRKTAPGLRLLDKKAVRLGGGDTHRMTLSDSVLIKDNHISAVGNLKTCIDRARSASSFVRKIEVEVEEPEEALEAARAGVDIVMFDNFTLPEIRKAVSLLEGEGMRQKVVIEASGGIILENIGEVAGSGVDVISMGMLTHSPRSLDMELRFLA